VAASFFGARRKKHQEKSHQCGLDGPPIFPRVKRLGAKIMSLGRAFLSPAKKIKIESVFWKLLKMLSYSLYSNKPLHIVMEHAQ
jgi:hypothetical protein